jgi:hypothetical protein
VTSREACERLQLQREIAGEKAAALGRAGERLEAALREAAGIARRLEGATDPAERPRLGDVYEQARACAGQARLALLIQREAVGLRQHRIIDQQFPAPPSPASR